MNMNENRLIGYRIAMARKQAKLTQAQLSEKARMDASTLSRLERGALMTSLETLMTLSDILDVGLEYILYDFLKETSDIDDPLVFEITKAASPLPDNYKRHILNEINSLKENFWEEGE